MMKRSADAPQDLSSGQGREEQVELSNLLLGFSNDREQLLPVLHEIQRVWGYVPAWSHAAIAEHFNLTRAEVQGVVSYYHDFRDTPPGEWVLKVCRAEACQSMGADALALRAEQLAGCGFGETRADGRCTLEAVYCLGLCATAPAIMLQDTLHARVTPESLEAILKATEGRHGQ